MEHPSLETLERFAQGVATRQERREVVRHLLRECGKCRAAFHSLLRPKVRPDAYDVVLAKWEGVFQEEVERLRPRRSLLAMDLCPVHARH